MLFEWHSSQDVLCFISPPYWTKIIPKWSLDTWLHASWFVMVDWGHSGYGTASKWSTQPSISCNKFDNAKMTNLSQQLRSFQVKLRAKIWYQWKPNIPLPLLINRYGFYGLREENQRPKLTKNSPPSVFSYSTTVSLFLLSPSWPSTTTTLTTSLTTTISTRIHWHNYQSTTLRNEELLQASLFPLPFSPSSS